MLRVVGGSYEGHIIGYTLSTDASADAAPPPPTFALKAHEGCVRAVAAGNALLATCGTDHTISVYNLRKLRTQGKLLQQAGGSSLYCLAFFRDTHLLSGGGDGELCIWRASDWECLLRMKGHKATVNAVAVHPSGRAALSVAADSKLMLWNLTTGKCNYTSALAEPARVVAWSTDGELYAYESRRAVSVFRLRTGELLHALPHEDSPPLCLVFLPKNLLVTGDDKGALRVWSLESGECLHTQSGAHGMRIKALATPAGDAAAALPTPMLTSASSDGTISVWTLEGAGGGAASAPSKKGKRPAAEGAVQLRRVATMSTRLRLTSVCVSMHSAPPAAKPADAGASSTGNASAAAREADDEEADEETDAAAAAPPPPANKEKPRKKKRASFAGEGDSAAAAAAEETGPPSKKDKAARSSLKKGKKARAEAD